MKGKKRTAVTRVFIRLDQTAEFTIKMSATMFSSAVMVLCVLGVRGDCEDDVIKKIYTLWGDNPPHDILPRIVGNQTYLYVPKSYDKEIVDDLICMKTELSLDKVSTTDYLIYKDPKKNSISHYDMVEEEKGVITNISGDLEDHMYVVSFNHGVLAIYQCGDGYEAFIYISIVNYNKKNLKQTALVAEATLKLTGLGKTFGKKMNPDDCPDN